MYFVSRNICPALTFPVILNRFFFVVYCFLASNLVAASVLKSLVWWSFSELCLLCWCNTGNVPGIPGRFVVLRVNWTKAVQVSVRDHCQWVDHLCLVYQPRRRRTLAGRPGIFLENWNRGLRIGGPSPSLPSPFLPLHLEEVGPIKSS